MKKIITTVGTSLFTNAINSNVPIENDYNEIRDKGIDEWDYYQNNRIKELKEDVIKSDFFKNQKASAEIQSILKIVEEIKENVTVYLIATATISSRLAAEIIKEFNFLEHQAMYTIEIQFNPQTDVIKGLQVKDRKKFEKEGLVNLLNRLEAITENIWEDSIFNITGGYKALTPFISLFCQFNRISAYYLFEEENSNESKYELITFPNIPINLDYSFFEKNINQLRLLNKGVENYLELVESISTELISFIWHEGNLAELNTIGKYFFNKYESHLVIYMLKGMASSIPEQKYPKRLYDSFDSLYSQIEKYLKSNSNLYKANNQDVKKSLDDQGESPLNHGSLKNTEYYIFKAPMTKPEIRLCYSFEIVNGVILKLNIFDFRIGEFNHSKYFDEFSVSYRASKDRKLIDDIIPIAYLKGKK